jgi:two-component system response regulator PilR (NtrC family)
VTRVLVVDDEPSMREFLSIALARDGYDVATAKDGVEALKLMEESPASVVLSDLSMPRKGGMELLEEVRQNWPETIVVIITAFGTIENAVKALHLGATDYVSKPFNLEEILLKIRRALKQRELERENVHLRDELRERYGLEGIIGQSEAIQQVQNLIRQVSGTDSTVLVMGESGTGKELVARAIHTHSRRSEGPFLTVNCAAMPESLLESELFGHVRGAFTGATAAREGLFRAATGGTLVLDEIGDMPLAMQAKLLRVLQDGRVRPVGGNEEQPTNVRIVAVTNRDLESLIPKGQFREDLYYRINVIHIQLPPLRDRKEDIPLLVEHFLDLFGSRIGRRPERVSQDAFRVLEAWDWPGNIRELENVIERAVTLQGEGELTIAALPERLRGEVPREALAELVRQFFDRRGVDGVDMEGYVEGIHKHLIEEALQRSGGNKTRAAELLGTTFRSLRYYAEKYGITSEDG